MKEIYGFSIGNILSFYFHSLAVCIYIEIDFDGISKDEASDITDESCRKLLANPNTETYKYELIEE